MLDPLLVALISIFIGLFIVFLVFGNIGSKISPEPVVAVPKEAKRDWKPLKILSKPGLHAESKDPMVITCYDPTSGGFLGTVRAHGLSDIENMLNKARKAQKIWAQTSFETRKQLLRALGDYLVRHQRDIADVCSRDSGKTFVDAFFGEILTTLEKIRWTCSNGEEVLKTEYRSVGMLTAHKLARVEYHPRGVVSAIVSWNYPFHNTFGPLISSLFAGNAIMIKCSEHVCWSSVNYFEKIIHALLESHGHPKELVQFVVGEAETGKNLIQSGVDKVTFIGSPHVGKKVMEACSLNLTPIVLELGGKDAAVICDDADMKQVIPTVMRGVFQNCGQNCIGLERLIVHESLYEEFIAQIKQRVDKMRVKAPLENADEVDCGAITMTKHIYHIKKIVDDAVSKGARLVAGGNPISCEGNSGQFFQPTVLADITSDMLISSEEVFGPVMAIRQFSSDQEAVDIVNSIPFGLGGSVFSSNVKRGASLMSEMKTGMGNVNDFAVNYLCQSLPFGGVKLSGFGRFAGPEGLRDECVMRSITVDRIPWLKTQIPSLLDYPIKGLKSENFCIGLSTLLYGQTINQKWNGLKDLIKAAVF